MKGFPGRLTQVGLLTEIFRARKEWWYLVLDQSILAAGGNTSGAVLNLAARHEDGRWIMIYLGCKASVSVEMTKLGAGKTIVASWIDPSDAREVAIGTVANTGQRTFSTPDGWEDALLILETSGG